jgi:hypothetical protein
MVVQKNECLGYFTFKGWRYYVNIYPMAANELQLVITDDIGEIQSVCYVQGYSRIYWKFNKPADDFICEIDKMILDLVKKWRDELRSSARLSK